MSKRTGLFTLREAAFQICQWIPRFTPLITAAYPGNTALLAAVEAANVACAALVAEADLALPVGD